MTTCQGTARRPADGSQRRYMLDMMRLDEAYGRFVRSVEPPAHAGAEPGEPAVSQRTDESRSCGRFSTSSSSGRAFDPPVTLQSSRTNFDGSADWSVGPPRLRGARERSPSPRLRAARGHGRPARPGERRSHAYALGLRPTPIRHAGWSMRFASSGCTRVSRAGS